MAFPSDLKMGNCVEWYTELPFQGRPRRSPVFFIKNVECYLECVYEPYCFYFLYLKPKTVSTDLKKFPFAIYCNFIEPDTFEKYNINNGYLGCCLYSFSGTQDGDINTNTIPKQGPERGYFVTFCFFYENKDEPLLPLDTKIEDKSVQTCAYLNAEVSSESSLEDFSKLLESGANHDAEIKCGEHSIRVHQIILSTRSEVLSTMLQSDMREGQTKIIEFKDMDIGCVQDFIRYLYTGVMPELTFDKAKILYEAGDKYAVRSLMLRCSEYLQDNLMPENAVQCFGLADAHSDQNLKGKVKTYLLEGKLYLQDELWLPFCESFPRVANEVYRLALKRKASEMVDV